MACAYFFPAVHHEAAGTFPHFDATAGHMRAYLPVPCLYLYLSANALLKRSCISVSGSYTCSIRPQCLHSCLCVRVLSLSLVAVAVTVTVPATSQRVLWQLMMLVALAPPLLLVSFVCCSLCCSFYVYSSLSLAACSRQPCCDNSNCKSNRRVELS